MTGEPRIDFSRGDEDVVFIQTELTDEVANKESPRKILLKKLEEKGLELENIRVIGIFKHEVPILLEEDSEIKLNGEKIDLDKR